MKREEEIKLAAIRSYPRFTERRIGFIDGAYWADQHPQFYKGQTEAMKAREVEFSDEWFKEHKEQPTYADAIAWAEKETIYKACEWLRMNMTDTIYMSTHGLQDLSKVDFINKFYEAMRRNGL